MYNFIRFITNLLMLLMHKKVINPQKLEYARNCLICANHISANDPPMIGALIKQKINYLAKIELFKNKLAARLLMSLNAIPVRRGRMDRKALRLVEERLAKGQSVVVFPEGTRRSASIKPGVGKFALEMNKDILPIFIENSDDIKGCIFGKKRLTFVIGDLIKIDRFKDLEPTKENFQYVADFVMEKINELKNPD